MGKNNRVLALIDGFNYYHKLKIYQKNFNTCVKWLDYKNMIEAALIDYDNLELEVIYFSAIAYHRSNYAVEKHKLYIKALEKSGVKIILGEFKEKFIDICYECQQKMPNDKILRHEEKNTDVNIAITMLEYAFKDKFDDCYLLSEDNDFVSVVNRVKQLYPEKRIVICPPPQTRYKVDNLVNASRESDFYRFRWNRIKQYQFPDDYEGLKNPWKLAKRVITSSDTVINPKKPISS